MRQKSWIKEIISQLIILAAFAAVLYFIYSELFSRPELSSVYWLRSIFYIAVAIFAVMFLVFLRQVFSNHALERYDPGSPESLHRLSRLRRFKFSQKYEHLQRKWLEPLEDIRNFFYDKDYNLIRSDNFDFVFERKLLTVRPWRARSFKRCFLFYHPMLNVLIVDQKLKQAERWTDYYWDQAASEQNLLVFITDMENYDEISSAGAGVANFLGTMKKGSLYPLLIDLDGGRCFFPLDVTMLKRRDRLNYYYYRWQIKRLIKRSVTES